MRAAIAVTLFGLLSAAPLAAQFQGTVTMHVTPDAGRRSTGDVTLKIAVKGDRSATVVTLPESAGPMAGMEVRSIYDGKTNTMTSLVPIPPQMASVPMFANAKGLKTVSTLSTGGRSKAEKAKVDVKRLGTSETVAGFACDDYEISSPNSSATRVCVTSALGQFAMPQLNGGMGRGASSTPAWAQAFGDKPVFPLKAWSTDGKVAMEVTGVDRGRVAADLFEIPEGYVDMAAMRGMRPTR